MVSGETAFSSLPVPREQIYGWWPRDLHPEQPSRGQRDQGAESAQPLLSCRMGHHGGKFMQLKQQLPTELQENGAPLSQTIMDMKPVSADVRVDIFKDQASVTALEDDVTVMEKMRAIIESENARNASNDKQQFTASMTAELRKLQAEVAYYVKSGGGTGKAGCLSQAYSANANKGSYTREAGSQKNRRTKRPTSRGRTSTTAGKCYFEACILQHTGICFVQCPWRMPPDFPRRDRVLQRRKEAGLDKKESKWETTGQAEKEFPSAMLASTTYQSDNLTNQPTLAAVASEMPAKTDRICPGLEPSLDDDAIRNFYKAGGSIKPLTLAPTPEPENVMQPKNIKCSL
eukprot:2309303-Pleurochrysis_carterae.AAC.1